jgi:hypothetical protein
MSQIDPSMPEKREKIWDNYRLLWKKIHQKWEALHDWSDTSLQVEQIPFSAKKNHS